MASFEIHERAHQGVAKSECFLYFDPLNEWRVGGAEMFPKIRSGRHDKSSSRGQL